MTDHAPEWHLLHRLWTKAVGTPGYIKDDWMKLEKIILDYEKLKDPRTKNER